MIYLDYAADAPLHPEIALAITDAIRTLQGVGANPSSLHAAGRKAKEFLEQSRARVAEVVGADPQEVVFTGGGTEADTLAVLGVATQRYRACSLLSDIVISALEHDAVVHAATYAGQLGMTTTRIFVDSQAVVDTAALSQILQQQEPALVAVMAVCNENGVIQPIEQVVHTVRWAEENAQWDRTATASAGATHVPIIVDAVQALGRLPLRFQQMGIDAMSIAAHKIGGLPNSGALIITRQCAVDLPGRGAGQERGIRPGTQDVVLAAALAATCERAESQREAEAKRLHRLREKLVAGACTIPGVVVATQANTVPDITQFVLQGCEAESVLFVFDQENMCVSAGSACRSGVARPSPVLIAQGYDSDHAMGGLRVSIGWGSSDEDIERFLQILPRAVEVSRKLVSRKVAKTVGMKASETFAVSSGSQVGSNTTEGLADVSEKSVVSDEVTQ
ncbi:MAG: cysteine desulfurase family protein [Actinomycetaceae bacterium]|nr:cysteine desulfurase family protein [Actinomycetaceae bacterium]